jgi:hypothetical protein
LDDAGLGRREARQVFALGEVVGELAPETIDVACADQVVIAFGYW